MPLFPASVLDHVRGSNLIGIRAGDARRDFLDIWMVVVDDRVFARSWGLAERSWYNTLLADAVGEIRCAETVVPIRGVVPDDLSALSERISAAYLSKYDSGANSFYAHGIAKPEHVARTMEFVPR